MIDFFKKVVEYIRGTGIPQQMNDVDYNSLFRNAWFMVPFVTLIVYLIYKKEFTIIALIGIAIAIWLFCGTTYMSNLIVGGEIQVEKILPIVFGGAIALAAIVYLIINKD